MVATVKIIDGTGIGPQDPSMDQIRDIPVGEMFCFVYKWRPGRDGTWWWPDFPWYVQVYLRDSSFSPRFMRVYGLSEVQMSRKKAYEAARLLVLEDVKLRS